MTLSGDFIIKKETHFYRWNELSKVTVYFPNIFRLKNDERIHSYPLIAVKGDKTALES